MGDTKLRADVPISIHPDNLLPQAEHLDKEGTVGRAAYAAGREALSAVHGWWAAVEDAERALQKAAGPGRRRQLDGRSSYLGDLRMRDGKIRRFTGHEEEFAEAAARAHDRAAATVQRRMDELRRYREGLAQKVGAVLDLPDRKSPEGLSVAQEVRSHLKAMEDKERPVFLQRAIQADDKRTVAAVLHAPAYLSGLSDDQSATIRDLAARHWATVDHAQLAAVDVVIDRVEHAGSQMMGRLAKVLAVRDTPRAEAQRKVADLAKGGAS
jgi:hypothetical protein